MSKSHHSPSLLILCMVLLHQVAYSQELTPVMEEFKNVCTQTRKAIISVTGDCFLVPRSFTGTPDGTTAGRAWGGTGEYRVEMTVTETCQMDNSYYLPQWIPRCGRLNICR